MIGEVFVAKKNAFSESDYLPRVPRSPSAPEGTDETEVDKTWPSDPKKHAAVADVLEDIREVQDYQQAHKIETYIFGLIQRRSQHARPSKPRTSLAHDTRAAGVARQSSLCHKDEQMPPKQVSAQEHSGGSQTSDPYFPKAHNSSDQDGYQRMGATEDPPSKCRHHQQQHQPGPYHRPRQASRSALLEYQPFRVLQTNPDSSNSEPDLPPSYHYHSPPPLVKAHQPPSPDDQLVNAKYIPAQPCRGSTRASGHQHSNPHKGFGASKPNQSTFSLERGHHPHLPEQQPVSQVQPSKSRGGAKKCRSNEDRGVASRKQGRKACRSQSENSLQRVPERKYNTVERDGAGSGSGGKGHRSSQSRSKKQHQGSTSYRRWQSTLELSQDEAEQLPMQASLQVSSNHKDNHGRRTRKSRPAHALHTSHHSHHHQHQLEYQLERVPMHPCQPSEDYHHPGQGESESSSSEADSPDSSSLSSDSDESGGLVWPQQLAPQLSPPTQPGAAQQPKAFVKIKASHALKKKILRFRTGSLKLMTTV